MPALVLSVANMKGGVGKTTIAIGLARTFAKVRPGETRPRVLVIDLDAQANASFCLCGDGVLAEAIERGKTIDAYLEDVVVLSQPRSLRDYVRIGANGLAVIPSSPELRLIEREMIYFLSEKRKSMREVERIVGEIFVAELEKLKDEYDMIVFDCAPGISAMTEAALRASDLVIVPTVPDFISNLGLEAFCKSVWWANRNGNLGQQTPWVVANMVKNSIHHQAMLRQMRAEADTDDPGFKMFRMEIPAMDAIEESGGFHGDPTAAAAIERSAEVFDVFAREVIEVIRAARH